MSISEGDKKDVAVTDTGIAVLGKNNLPENVYNNRETTPKE